MRIFEKKMQNFASQAGMTLWGVVYVLCTLGFMAFVGMQLVPVYSADQSVRNAMIRSMDGKDIKKASRGQIIKAMQQQLHLDGNHGLFDYNKSLKVTRDRSKLAMAVNYERRIPLFHNISIVADFDTTIHCDYGGKCVPK